VQLHSDQKPGIIYLFFTTTVRFHPEPLDEVYVKKADSKGHPSLHVNLQKRREKGGKKTSGQN